MYQAQMRSVAVNFASTGGIRQDSRAPEFLHDIRKSTHAIYLIKFRSASTPNKHTTPRNSSRNNSPVHTASPKPIVFASHSPAATFRTPVHGNHLHDLREPGPSMSRGREGDPRQSLTMSYMHICSSLQSVATCAPAHTRAFRRIRRHGLLPWLKYVSDPSP